jgi:O-antigen/teichoic acid export membrane protein
MGWQGRILSWLITSVLFFFIAFTYFRKEGFLKGAIKIEYIREGILFGLPLIVHTIGKFVVNQSDRIFIAKMTSLDEAGIYNIGYTFGFLVTLFSNSFFYIFSPYVLERLPAMTQLKALQIVKMSYLYIVSIICVLLITTLVAPVFFKYFIDHRYLNGQKYVFWVGLGYVFFSFYGLFSTYIMYHNQNSFLAWLAVFNIMTNLLFNYLFILLFGAIGAAYATALSFFLIFIFVAIKGNKLVHLPWMKFRDIIKVPIT